MSTKPTSRRPYDRPVGVLCGNNFTMEKAVDIAEEGLVLQSQRPMNVNERILVNFHLENTGYFIIPSAITRVSPAPDSKGQLFELVFTKLSFEYRRALRAFIAAKPVTFLIEKPWKKVG